MFYCCPQVPSRHFVKHPKQVCFTKKLLNLTTTWMYQLCRWWWSEGLRLLMSAWPLGVCDSQSSNQGRHSCLFVAIFSISLLVYPICFVSVRCLFARCSVAVLWVGVPFDGLTGDGFWRFPKGMSYPSSCIVSSLFHFSIGSSLVHSQSVVLDTLSDHFVCRNLRRHLLMKVCILFSVFCVLRHVSDPQSSTVVTVA